MRLQQLEDIQDLNDYFPRVVEELKEHSKECGIPSETEWFGKCLEHTVPGGKMVRCIATFNAMRQLAGPDKLTDDYMRKAKSFAWSVEMLQAAQLIMDDISDGGRVRRGKPSWHMIAGPGAVIDAVLVEHASYQLLKLHFSESPFYNRVLQLYLNTMFKVSFGQNLDNHCLEKFGANFDEFTILRHRRACELKSGEYTFYLPTAAALVMHGIMDKDVLKVALEIGENIGYLYQVQNDYMDCYGSADKTGKPGTDIAEGKCSWIVAEAKTRANRKQLQVLRENYGHYDEDKVAAVLAIFEELNMKTAFFNFERDFTAEIHKKINMYSDKLPPELFNYVLESTKYFLT